MSRADLKNLAPPLTEARIERQFAAIRARTPASVRRRPAWAGWAVAAVASAALAVVLFRSAHPKTTASLDAAVLESGAAVDGAVATAVTLVDGSRVELGATTLARLTSVQAKAIRLDLERGRLDIEATHVEGRTFVVGAGAYDVHVVGTHFSVTREPGAVSVRVDRGAVEITGVGGAPGVETRRLAAGEQWTGPDGASGQPVTSSTGPSSLAPALPVAPTSADVSPVAPVGAASSRRDEGPRELFDDAQRARADGRASDAARAFDRLRRSYPRDPRAALSAFELGRLRLDVLGDPRGAEEALRDAMALGPTSPFREDAEARRVEALGRAGDMAGCVAARSAYLARWPEGTYRRAVELGCGGR